MAIKAQYAGNCKDCGAHHDVGDMIDKNGNESQNTKGEMKSHWCKNGKNCQGTMQLPSTLETKLQHPGHIDVKEPTPEELLETARELNKQDTLMMLEDAIINTYNEAAHKAIVQLVRQAAINNIMDKAGIKHPSRVAFVHEVMESLRE